MGIQIFLYQGLAGLRLVTSSRHSEKVKNGENWRAEGKYDYLVYCTLSQLGAISSKASLLSSMDEFMFRFKQHSVYLPSALMS